MDSLKPQLPEIRKEDRTPLVDMLLEFLAWQQMQIDPTFRPPAIRNQHISEHTVHQAG